MGAERHLVHCRFMGGILGTRKIRKSCCLVCTRTRVGKGEEKKAQSQPTTLPSSRRWQRSRSRSNNSSTLITQNRATEEEDINPLLLLLLFRCEGAVRRSNMMTLQLREAKFAVHTVSVSLCALYSTLRPAALGSKDITF